MKKRSVISTLFTAVAASAMLFVTSCGGKSSGAPTLIWWQIGSSKSGFEKHMKTISAYTEEKIGVRVDIKQAGWGDASQRFTTMVNAGEYYDIMFTDASSYNRFVGLGAFADLSEFVQTETPALYEYIPESLWDGVRVKGKIYAVPTYKDSARTVFGFWDDAIVQKYGINIEDSSWRSLDTAFRKIKEGEGGRYYPMILARGENTFAFENYDPISADLPPIGVKLTDTNHKVVNTLEQADVLEAFTYLHKWYEDEIINPDANMVDETPKYRPFFLAQAWPMVAGSYATTMGIPKVVSAKFSGPTYSTDSIQGSLTAISANSKYQKEALKLIELVNTDTKLRDMIAYGIEGTHFSYVTKEDGTKAVHRDSTDWPLINYQEGTFFTETPEDNVPTGYWEEVKGLNEAASNSVMLGFMLDLEPIQAEIINCRSVWGKYYIDLKMGVSDPATMIPQVMSELKAAGFDKVLEEAQRQVDEFFAKQ
ncbi:MAG: ABC transporter substrate-binding protein [Treponemataceae bacterium]|nr:MAG: ABC transporter substrate-binding protein [Treponemataceae bacterium]